MNDITFMGSTNIQFGRKLGSKDKKKRKVIDNGPRTDGQAPMSEIGQQRTGYKYYRKRRALGFIGATGVLGGITGAALGGTAGIILKNPNKGAMIGAGLGATAGSGASLLEHRRDKHSPFYKKKKKQ